jgi:flavin-binding protein dodecin
MSKHVYTVSEIVGSSHDSIEDAVQTAIAEASQTLRNLDWFEVTEIRGHLEEGRIAHWQVGIKLGFRHES